MIFNANLQESAKHVHQGKIAELLHLNYGLYKNMVMLIVVLIMILMVFTSSVDKKTEVSQGGPVACGIHATPELEAFGTSPVTHTQVVSFIKKHCYQHQITFYRLLVMVMMFQSIKAIGSVIRGEPTGEKMGMEKYKWET